ncbi:MAG TPA: Gfo/Idh/MocA family oxidoreductase [Anaerolineales bacterium]|nr:Gfo/Idh/MocA family oxidoreductase [Anaerolineales bacterium]
MQQDIRVGVIGVGRMGQRHCRVFANLRHVDLVGVCDANPENGQRMAQQYGVACFAEIDRMLERVDAVSIAAPTPLHFDLAARCLAAGKHVLVEKPITETVAQAEQLTALAEASGLVCMVGHIERFNAAYIELKNVLETMTPLAINFRRLSAFAGSNVDVDVVLDLMIHDLNLVLDLTGAAPTRISAQGLNVLSNTIDHAVVNFRFETGPLISVTASRVTEHKVRSIEVTAREAYLDCDLLNKSICVCRETIGEYLNQNQRGVKYRQESVVERIQVPIVEPMFLELQHFVECVIERKPPLVSARDGLQALALADQVRRMILDDFAAGASSHKPVELLAIA